MWPSSRTPLPPPPVIASQKLPGSSVMATASAFGVVLAPVPDWDGRPASPPGDGRAGAHAAVIRSAARIASARDLIAASTRVCGGPAVRLSPILLAAARRRNGPRVNGLTG